MAHLSPSDPTNPPRLIPAPADLALEAATAELYGGLREHHNRLLNAHQRLRDLRPDRPLASGGEHPGAQIITDRDEITQLSHSLINLARSDMMTMDNCLQETPIQQISVIPPLPRFQGAVRYRSIYQTTCLEHPIIAKAIEASVQAGEEARVLPEVGMKMKLVDDTLAMLPLTRTGMGGALILRAAVVIGDLRKYFEMLWERATPLGAEEAPSNRSPLNDIQQQVLLLLSQGLQDEAIARRTGQSVQTVRRHASAIKTLLDVETRFAAGVAAIRRGWLT
jgi:DNA-binding CsgD family transcriptional regulator